ncbi:MAG: hypothetical protein WC069_06960, partial [Candidatus Shapirobacteria bacterium]
KEPKEIKCGKCNHIFKSSRTCPKCGYEMISRGEAIPFHKADLVEIKKVSSEDKEIFYRQLLGYCRLNSKSDGFAYWTYKEKYGVGPAWEKKAMEPGQEVLNYIKHKQIKFAKSRSANEHKRCN